MFFHALIIDVLVVFVFFSRSRLRLDADTGEGKLYRNVFWRFCLSFGGGGWDGAFLISVNGGPIVVSSPL